MTFRIFNTDTNETVYEVTANHSMSLDEALNFAAPDDWRERVDAGEPFVDGDSEIYYDDLDIEVE